MATLSGYHSINIGDYNTYHSFHLIPDGRPVVNPPETKTSYVDVPGADGSLDYTEALNGLKYNNRKGSWEFYVLNDYHQKGAIGERDWTELYSSIMRAIHGKKFDSIWLEDDTDQYGNPKWTYKGRVYVNSWKSDPNYSKITIDYELDSYKYPISTESTSHKNWIWNDLTNGPTASTIYYGTFTVNQNKDRTIIGSGPVSIYCSTSGMSISFYDGRPSVQLESGNNENVFTVRNVNGDRVRFAGSGKVELYYGEGRSL